ncbi:MAG: 4'-phosphopantetheinyl transferase superfamily protein [Muribaculum sp.]|nr:4'-phosphopantetheinyl transferase superfamily protein [Muribaculum sp.]
MKCYLLSVEEFEQAVEAERLRASALERLDAHRLEKVRRSRTGTARNLALGAGLVLQLAVQEGMRQERTSACEVSQSARGFKAPDGAAIRTAKLPILTVSEALERLAGPVQIAYRCGAQGKPDFAQEDWHFNLSHSGRYVCCVLDRAEVGVDLQQMRPFAGRNPGERFFAPRERELLAACEDVAERELLFYRLWVRKESYAKLTGEGIAAAVARDVAELERDVVWQTYDLPEGYCMAVCRYRKAERCVPPEQ